jgi:hypothetical protein
VIGRLSIRDDASWLADLLTEIEFDPTTSPAAADPRPTGGPRLASQTAGAEASAATPAARGVRVRLPFVPAVSS